MADLNGDAPNSKTPYKRRSRATPPETHKRSGRPPSHTHPIGYDDTGAVVTALEQIPKLIRVGMYLEGACSASGIRPHAAYEWMRIGAMAFYKRHTAQQLGNPPDLTQHEQACLQFNLSVVRAEGEWEQEQNLVLGQLGRGGLRITKTTVKRGPPTGTMEIRDSNGEVQVVPDPESGPILEATTVTEILPPSERVIFWRLERRFPEFYGRKIEVLDNREGVVPSVADHADQLVDDLNEFLSGGSEVPE